MLALRFWWQPLAWLALSSLLPAQQTRAVDPARSEPCFDGTGGPNGDFDWYVRRGEIFFFDTSVTLIAGGPGGVPVTVQTALNGLVNVRDLVIEEGGEIRCQGPNPVRIQASRNVVIRGLLNASGFNARGVVTLNTGNMTEVGAAGGPGGGRGGNANVITTNSSPRGEDGHGPAGRRGEGGQGGESSYAPAVLGVDARRPGGGGGGRFAADGAPANEKGQPGADGHPLSSGAESSAVPARGGALRAGPFGDGDPRNDFFGEAPLSGGRFLQDTLRGELVGLLGGFGGGGGGNAAPAAGFPTPGWNFGSDEKGGPGGGGGGVVHVQALGQIVFGRSGEIRADGGRGGTGENTNFLDHVGGSGGSGSGGHVVLEAAGEIDFTDRGANSMGQGRNWISALGGTRVIGPTQYVTPGLSGLSNGGAGGPGVVQLHVRDPLLPPDSVAARSDIVVPLLVAHSRNPLDQVASPAAWELYPTCALPPLPLRDGGSPRAHAPQTIAPAHALALDWRRMSLALGF